MELWINKEVPLLILKKKSKKIQADYPEIVWLQNPNKLRPQVDQNRPREMFRPIPIAKTLPLKMMLIVYG
jgi:hypothetical protein